MVNRCYLAKNIRESADARLSKALPNFLLLKQRAVPRFYKQIKILLVPSANYSLSITLRDNQSPSFAPIPRFSILPCTGFQNPPTCSDNIPIPDGQKRENIPCPSYKHHEQLR